MADRPGLTSPMRQRRHRQDWTSRQTSKSASNAELNAIIELIFGSILPSTIDDGVSLEGGTGDHNHHTWQSAHFACGCSKRAKKG
jgi:hypothetical protein